MPRITRVTVERIPSRVRGVFRIAYAAESTVEHLVVKVELSDGSVGYGEAAPSRMVTWENTGSVESYVSWAGERLAGLELPGYLGDALRIIHGSPGFSSARAGLEEAVIDAAARAAGVSPMLILGGSTGGGLLTDYTVSIPGEDVLEELRAGRRGRRVEAFIEAVEYLVGLRGEPPEEPPIPLPGIQGFHALKVKVGTGSPWLDYELVRLVDEASQGKAAIRVDANQAWTPKTAVRVVGRLEALLGDRLEVVEQPTPAQSVEGLRFVRDHTATPIAADESARSMVEVARIAALHAADIVNIKLAKIGGPLQAVYAAKLAKAHGLSVMWGCMVESGYGIAYAAAAALAAGETGIVDLDSPLFLEDPPGMQRVEYHPAGRGVELRPLL